MLNEQRKAIRHNLPFLSGDIGSEVGQQRGRLNRSGWLPRCV